MVVAMESLLFRSSVRIVQEWLRRLIRAHVPGRCGKPATPVRWRVGGSEALGGILSIVQCSSSSARPRLRGVWHKWACVWSVPFGVALVLVAHDARARVAVSVYAATLAALF